MCNIFKSAEDKRTYKYVLLPNDLKCLLISDVSTNVSAAALNVQVGSFYDPDELPGLAHLCEHAIFMGSEKVYK